MQIFKLLICLILQYNINMKIFTKLIWLKLQCNINMKKITIFICLILPYTIIDITTCTDSDTGPGCPSTQNDMLL